MATASVPGFRAALYLATSSSGGTIVKFGELKDFTLTVAQGALDATSKDSAGWKEFLSGLNEWGGSGTGLYLLETTDAGQNAIFAALSGDNPVWLQLREAASSMMAAAIELFTGLAVVTQFDVESPLDGPALTKCAFKGTSVLTRKAATS